MKGCTRRKLSWGLVPFFAITFSTAAVTARAGDPAGASGAGAAEQALTAADFTGKDLEGKSVTLSDLLKKGPVLLDFWTTWCSPCRREMPELDRLHRTYRDNGFQVVMISEDDPKTMGKVKPAIQSRKYEFLVLLDPDKKIGNAYNVRQYPTSFLVKGDGTIAHFAQGYLPGDEKKLEGLVVGLVGAGTGIGTGAGDHENSGKDR